MTTGAPRGDTVIRPPLVWGGPVPAHEDWSAPYWDSLRRHQMAIQRCAQCGAWHHPPVMACPICRSDNLTFEPVHGQGRLYSVTVCHREFGLQFGVPWIAAYVELDEGPRIATNVINTTPDAVFMEQRVSVVYQDYDDIDLTLAFFEPSGRDA